MSISSILKTVLAWTLVAPLLTGGSCDHGDDPATNGSIQLFYDINVEEATALGLEGLVSLEITSSRITAKLHSAEFSGKEYIMDDVGGTTVLPAQTQLITGNHFEVPPGFITQLRIYPEEVKFNFSDGSSAPIRVPSSTKSGWKVVVDEEAYPDGYEVLSSKVTGILLFMTLDELFHHDKGQGWMARPTIKSQLYNILDNDSYDSDKVVVVFNPATAQSTIDDILFDGNFTVDFRYPNPPPLLYKLDLPPNMSLRDAHSYLRGFTEVWAVAPSAKIFERQLVPSEGTPPWLDVLDAETGWDAVQTLLGTVGVPDVVLAEVSTGGFNIEHNELWPNIWLNEDELLPVCGNVATCDADMDGFITLRDFNDPGFPAAQLPPDSNGDGNITCVDLLVAGNPYVNGFDDGGNGFDDDLCGWNFASGDRFVIGTSNHDTGVAGIMGAIGNNQGPGGAVGVCWSCRIMAVVAALSAPLGVGSAEGATAETVAAFAYARDNEAHVVNFSAGLDLIPSNGNLCPARAWRVDKAAYDTVISEMNDVITAAFNDLTIPTPLYTLAGGECSPGINEEANDYYDWPPEAFAAGAGSSQTAITVAATANTVGSVGDLADYSNFGAPFEIAAPGTWLGLLNGTSNTTNNYGGQGTSFAAPTVGGIAGLVASGDLTSYTIPDGDALKAELLSTHAVVDPGVESIPGSKIVTMTNLP